MKNMNVAKVNRYTIAPTLIGELSLAVHSLLVLVYRYVLSQCHGSFY